MVPNFFSGFLGLSKYRFGLGVYGLGFKRWFRVYRVSFLGYHHRFGFVFAYTFGRTSFDI